MSKGTWLFFYLLELLSFLPDGPNCPLSHFPTPTFSRANTLNDAISFKVGEVLFYCF